MIIDSFALKPFENRMKHVQSIESIFFEPFWGQYFGERIKCFQMEAI